jgi:hypothetical protein
MRFLIGAALVATLVSPLVAPLGRQALAAGYDHARFRIIVANQEQVVGIVEDGVAATGPIRPAQFAIYMPAPLDVPGSDGKFIGKSDLSIFRAMIDCDRWKMKALGADYFLTPGKARLHHVDYKQALYMLAEAGPPDVIATHVCAEAPPATSEVYQGLDEFIAAAKAKF